jgi:glycine dehydrogenase subunit 2
MSYDLPYDQPCMHECVFSDRRQAAKGVHTMDIAKRLIDYGFHPYTTAFPLIVPGALMIEPTESASKEELDAFIDALQAIADEVEARSAIRSEGPLHHARHPPRRSRRRPQARPALEAPDIKHG